MNFMNEDYTLTSNFFEAIFIDKYGNMVDGEFDCGLRGLDHNCILEHNTELSHSKKWENIHKQGIVRLVPESKTALIMDFQPLSAIQTYMIEKHGYEIEFY